MRRGNEMRRRSWIFLVLMLAAVLAVFAVSAAGAEVEARGKPTTTIPGTTTTTSAPSGTCASWGPAWTLGSWNGSAYVVRGLPGCIDIDQLGHAQVANWTISWEVTALRPMKGIQFVFESQPGRREHASYVATTPAGTVPMTIGSTPPIGTAFKFSAMPFRSDRYTNVTITVTPGS